MKVYVGDNASHSFVKQELLYESQNLPDSSNSIKAQKYWNIDFPAVVATLFQFPVINKDQQLISAVQQNLYFKHSKFLSRLTLAHLWKYSI